MEFILAEYFDIIYAGIGICSGNGIYYIGEWVNRYADSHADE
ncbi:MAG TPA: hypothetical protein PK304_08225 [Mobilitalea sp.]|nr:hypothetical protein [Mobilitalea sp.]